MSSNAYYAVLETILVDIESEAEKLRKVFERETLDLVSEDPISRLIASAAISSIISKIYTKVEDVFYKVAQKIDEEVPKGDSWHLDLLRQMKVETDDRPALLSDDAYAAFDHLRRFRHFERNSYASEISADEMPEKVRLALGAVGLLRRDFTAFAASYFGTGNTPINATKSQKSSKND